MQRQLLRMIMIFGMVFAVALLLVWGPLAAQGAPATQPLLQDPPPRPTLTVLPPRPSITAVQPAPPSPTAANDDDDDDDDDNSPSATPTLALTPDPRAEPGILGTAAALTATAAGAPQVTAVTGPPTPVPATPVPAAPPVASLPNTGGRQNVAWPWFAASAALIIAGGLLWRTSWHD